MLYVPLATTISSTVLSASADSSPGIEATLTVLVPGGAVGVGVGVGAGVAVGAGVGMGVGVGVAAGVAVGDGVAVGAGVDVGAGVAVGAGVGVAVGFGVAVGVGSGVAVGSGVGVAAGAAVTSKSAATDWTTGAELALGPGDCCFFLDDGEFADVVAAVRFAVVGAVTARTCDPSAVLGTRNVTLKLPRVVVVKLGIPAVEPSQVRTSCARLGNAWPVAVTVVPGAPLVGERERSGPAGAGKALVATNGRA